MSTTKKQLIVKPEFNDFLQAVDEYTEQIPAVIRQTFRQALHSEYGGGFRKDGGTLQRHDDKSSG